jgi:hypothetical protein
MLRRLTCLLGSTALAATLALAAGGTRADDDTKTPEASATKAPDPSAVTPAETGGPWHGMLANKGFPVCLPRRPVYYDCLNPVACPWKPIRLLCPPHPFVGSCAAGGVPVVAH